MTKDRSKPLEKRNDPIGEYIIKKPSFFRQLTMESFDAIPAGHNMMAFIEFDVTDARAALKEERKNGKKLSLFAFVIKSIATVLAENPELNSVRSGRRIYEFKEVDVNLPIELSLAGEKVPRQIVIRNASSKTVEQITLEIDTAKKQHEQAKEVGPEDKWAFKLMQVLLLLPKWIRNLILKGLISNPLSVKKMSGTTFITSVGMFGNIPGFVAPYMAGPRAVSFAVGSVVKKPVIVGQEILNREILQMTIIFNHDIVDGAPAARFTNRLKKLIENTGSIIEN